MNKLCYRIVFNKMRGMCMVVQETARSRSKGPGMGVAGGASSSVMHLPALRRLAVLVAACLGSIGCVGAVMAQIVADPNAPGQQRATVLNAANGVLQVNIQTPSGAGVSRNVYSQFDVPKSGAILNNSRTNVQSQLGGWVQGNPWLSTGTARVILNEVNSSNPSRLQGYIEVAGTRAETIIANPAGIVVDGGGFINVSRATLTTGSPVLEDGRVKGYSVQRGQIGIDGVGLDASKTDYTALIARSLQVNAGLWAQRLNIVTGVNEVAEAEQAVVTRSGQSPDTAPAYAVDVARLGGMYANQIYLVGTEAGVGVHNAGAIGAGAGDLVVTAAGRLENGGTLSATRDVKVDASGIDSGGRMQAGETLTLNAGSMVNGGLLSSSREALIVVQGEVDNSHGRIEAPRIDLTATALRNAQGSIVQSGTQALAIDAANIINTSGVLGRRSGTAAGGATPEVGSVSGPDSTGAAPRQDGATGPDAGSATSPAAPVPADGRVQVGTLDNTGGVVASAGAAMLRTASLDNHAGEALLDTLTVSGPNFDNTGGTLTVLHGFDAHAGRFVNDQGKLLVAAAFDGALGTFSNRQGLLQAAQIGIHATGPLDNSGGTIRATHDLALQSTGTILNPGGSIGTLSDSSTMSVTASSIDNGDGRIVNAGSGATVVRADAIVSAGLIGGNGNVDIVAHTMHNDAGGAVAAQGDLNLMTDVLFANAGRVDAGGHLQMLQDGAQLNNSGTMAAQGAIDVRVASIDNSAGTIATAAGSGSHVELVADSFANRAGTIVADGQAALAIRGGVDNEHGHVRAATGLSIDATGRIENRGGDIESAASLLLHGADIGNDAGRIAAVGMQTALIDADRTLDSNGSIGANGRLTLRAQTLTNGTAGAISAGSDLDLVVSAAVDNGGAIGAAGTLRLDQPHATLVNHGSMTAATGVHLDVEQADNRGGAINGLQGADVALRTNAFDNRDGRLIAGRDASILVTDAVDNGKGLVQAGGSLAITTGAALRNHDGTIEALGEHGTLTVHAGAIDNAAGRITGIGDGTVTVEAGHIASSGLIAGNGQLNVFAVSLANAGTISAGSQAELAVSRQVDNSGTVSAAAGLRMHQAALDLRNSGTIVAGGTIDAVVATLDNANGRILTAQGSGGDLLVDARSIGNHGGLITADHDAILKATDDVDGQGGLLQAGAQLHLDVGGHVDVSAGGIETLAAGSTLQVHAGALRNEAGHIVNAGQGATRLQIDADLLNSGRIAGNGTLAVSAQAVTNAHGGDIVAAGVLQLQAHASLDNAGSISSGAALTIDERQTALSNHGTIVATGDVTVRAAAIDNDGGTLATAKDSGANLQVQGTRLSNRGGRIVADRAATLSVDETLDNGGGTIAATDELRVTAAGAVVNDGGAIETAAAGSTLTLRTHDLLNGDGRIVGTGHGTTAISVADSLVNRGVIAGNGNVDLQATTVVNAHGAMLTSNAAMTATIGNRLENAGTIGSDTALEIAAHTATIVNSGQVVAAGAIGVASADFVNDGGRLATVTGSGASLALDARGVSNRRGAIQSDRDVQVHSADGFDNTGGVLQAAGSLRLSAGGAMANDGGVIETLGPDATLSLHADQLDNGNGRLANVGSGATAVTVDGNLVNRGTVAGNAGVELHVGGLDNRADGSIVSGSDLRIKAAQNIGNEGTISSRHASTFDAIHGQVANHGVIVSGASATLTAARIDNDAGQIVTTTGSDGDIALRANDISNVGGKVMADGALTVDAAGAVANRQGTAYANRAIRIDAGGALGNQEGAIEVAATGATLHVRAGTIDNDRGRLVNAGAGATGIAAAGTILNGGTLGGNGAVDLRAAAVFNQVGGTIASGAALDMRIDERLDNVGRIDAATTLNIGQTTTQIDNSGEIAATGDLAIAGAAIANAGGRIVTRSGASVLLRSESTLSNRAGTIAAGGSVTVETRTDFDNTHGQVQTPGVLHVDVNGAVTNAGGVLESVGTDSTLTLRAGALDNAAGRIVNTGTGQTQIDSATAIVNGGTIGGNGALSLSAQDLTSTADGVIAAGTALALTIGRQLENAGTIGSGTDMHVDVTSGTVQNTGAMSAGGRIEITAGALGNQGGHIATRDGSGGAITLAAASLNNTSGTVAADGLLHAAVTGAVVNDGGVLHGGSGAALAVSAALANGTGTIEAASGALDVAAASIDSSGRIVNAGSGRTDIVSGTDVVNGGTIAGNGDLGLSAQVVQNLKSGTVGAGTAMDLAVSHRFDNAGSIGSGTSLHLRQPDGSFSNAGKVEAGGPIDIASGAIVNQTGQIDTVAGSGAAVQIHTGSLQNAGGTISADGALGIDVASAIANDGGALHGGAGASLHAGGRLANGSGVIEAASGTLGIRAQSISNGGRIVDAGNGQMTIESGTDLVNGGMIAANGGLALDSRNLVNTASISAGGPLDVNADAVSNAGGKLYTGSGSGTGIRMNAGSIDNTGGTVSADGLFAVAASDGIANGGGTMHGGSGVSLHAGAGLANGSGTIESAAGALQIQARAIENSGRIVNAGAEATTIDSATFIVNEGTVAGNGGLTLSAKALDNKDGGTLRSGGPLELAVRERLDNAGTINSAGTLRFDQSAATFGNSGTIGAGGSVVVTAATVNNTGGRVFTGSGSGGAIDLHAARLDSSGGTVSADGTLHLDLGGDVVNNGGVLHGGSGLALHAGGTIANGSGAIEVAAGALDIAGSAIDSGGRIVNAGTGRTVVDSKTAIVNRGTIAGNGALALSGTSLENMDGAVIGGALGLELALMQRLDNAGTVSSGRDLRVDQAAVSVTNTGSVTAAGVMHIAAASIANRGGKLVAASGSDASMTLAANSLDNSSGVISADGALRVVVAGSTDNSAGTLHGGTGMVLDAGGILANAGGTVETAKGTLHLQAASIDNTAGRIVNAGDGATNIVSAGGIDNGGTIAGNGTLEITARTLHSASGGAITAVGAMELAVREQLVNAGTIGSGGSLHIDQPSVEILNTGRIGAAGAIDVAAAAIANVGGQLYTSADSGAGIQLHTGSLDNTGGTVSADGALHVQVVGSASNGGVLHSGAGTAVDVGGALRNGGGTIEAAAGALDIRAAWIDSSGRIVNGGSGAMRVDSATSIVNSGTIAAHNELTLGAAALQNDANGSIGTGSGAALELAVRERLENAGTISSGGGLHVDQAATSLVNTGIIGAAGTLDISARTIDNAGGRFYTATGSDGAIGLHAGGLHNVAGTVAADGLLNVAVTGDVVNDGGTLHGGTGTVLNAGGTLANGSGTIEASAGMLEVLAQSITSNGRIVNGGTGVTAIASEDALANRGIIGGNGRVDLRAAALRNEGGQITSGGDMLLDVHQALVNTGAISSNGSLTFDQAGASLANGGQMTAGGAIRLTAGVFGNDGGRIATARGSGGDIVVSASSLSNRNGSILADGNAIVSSAGGVDNDNGVLQAGGSLLLTAAGNVGNDGGAIETLGNWSALLVQADTIDNGSGRISNAGSGDIRLLAHDAIFNRGGIAGMGNLFMSGQSLSNASGATLASGNNLTLAFSRQVANYGKVNSAGSLTFEQAGATFTNGGELFAGGNAVIHAGVVNNDGGQLGTSSGSAASLALASQQLSNQGGRIATDGDLSVDTHLVAGLGELFAGRDLALSMGGDFVQGGAQQVHSNRNLTLSVTGNIDNASTLATAGTLTLAGQNIANGAGAAIEGRNVILNAWAGLNNAGEIDGQDTLDIHAAAIANSGGIVGGNVALSTARLDNAGPSALIGATGTLNLGVSDVLNNVGGATLYSSGDMTIAGQCGCDVGAVNNISSTIEAGGDLRLKADSLRNVRENVQIVQVKTVDETVHMTMPGWREYGDNHESFEKGAANYRPHEVYFVRPSDILEDQVYVTPDGNTIHRAVIRTHANDSAFYVASSGLFGAYGRQSRLTLSEGTSVIYYMEAARLANPDQDDSAHGNAIVHAGSVEHWDSSISFSNHYGNCSDDCIRLVTQPEYADPRTTRIVDDSYAQSAVQSELEYSLSAHHVALDDQLAPGAGAAAQILSGGSMHLTVGSTLENRFGDIKARGGLVIDGSAAIDNVGVTLYRTHAFNGTWTTYGGADVAYQRAGISEAIGSVAGVIQGGQGVSIDGRSFRNIDVSAGTLGNIRDAVNVIGSGVVLADRGQVRLGVTADKTRAAGVDVTSGNGSDANTGARVDAGASESGAFAQLASVTAGEDGAAGGVAGTRVETGAGISGERISAAAGPSRHAGVHAEAGGATETGGVGRLSRSVIDTDSGLGTTIATTGHGSHLTTALRAAASGVENAAQAGGTVAGTYANDAVAAGTAHVGGAAHDIDVTGAAHRSGAVGDERLGGLVAATRNAIHLGGVRMTGDDTSAAQSADGGAGGKAGHVVKVNPGGLFLRNPDSNGSYLFETRPQFANQRAWTSSDYLLKQLAFDPATTQKRLGDGFYEQRMVREQLTELTGHALYGGASDDSIYKELLTNAVSMAREFELRPGVALSAEQVSRLTSDIAWMETETVMLPDGRTETVLVPKVYLAHVGQHALQPNGALVTGNDVAIRTMEDIVNKGGVIDGGNGRTVLVAARDIVNQGGSIKGDAVTLAAGRDVRNESLAVTQTYDFGRNGGSYTSLSNQAILTAAGAMDIIAGRDLSDVAGKISAGSANLTAGRNISFDAVKTGSTYRSQIDGYTEKDSAVTHQLSQVTTTGDLKVAATGDLKLNGTQVVIGTAGQGDGQLLAGGAVTIASVTNEINTSVQNDPHSKQYDKQVHENQSVIGADVSATGKLTVGAGMLQSGALTVTGSSVTAGDALKLTASDSVNIDAAQEKHLSDTALSRSSHSLLKSKTTQQADYVARTDAVGSGLSGKTVDVNAGKDINVLGSGIAGDTDVRLVAEGSVNITAATRTLTEQHHSQVKERGFLSGDGFGFSIGARTTTTDQSRDATTQSGQSRSVVGAVRGKLDIVAGDIIKIGGSDLAAGSNMTLAGRSIVIDAGQDASKDTFKQTSVQNGLSFAVGGSVVNAIQTTQRMTSAAAQTKDTRFKALAAATAVMTANDAVDDLAKNGPSARISLTAGHSESESTQVTASNTHTGSALTAGGNVTISATGGGKASNLDITGSNVRGSGSVALIADNHINLLAAQDTDSQHSKTRSTSASLGVAANIGTSGMKVGVTASASASRGNVDGDGTTYVGSHVTAGDQLTIASGGDTDLRGAVASGRQVIADVKGNLNIESQQDTARLDGKRQSASASGTFGAGAGTGLSASASASQVHNDFASVAEQSGIRAGDGGFKVQVVGNTDLKGGVISSSETAIKDGRNSLVTGSLSYTDIQNHDKTEASGISLSGNVGTNQSGDTFSPSIAPGIGHVRGEQSSVTRSGISGGELKVKDRPSDAAGLNRDVVTGKDTAQALVKAWNGAKALDEVGAQMEITSAAMPRLAKEIGDYAQNKVVELKKQGNSEEAAKWEEGGVYRVAAHAALGAMGGGAGGAVGAAAAAEAAPTLGQLQNALQEKLTDAGLGNAAADAAAKLLVGSAAGTIGGAAGGAAGAVTGLNADINNRQLHPKEIDRIKRLAAGNPEKEARLTVAACALVKCYAEYAENSAEYIQLKRMADIGATATFAVEREQLSKQLGMFGYSTAGILSDANLDFARKINNTYQVSTRAIGAGQTALGVLGVAGSIGAGATTCVTGLGCLASAGLATVSLDVGYAGAKQVISGESEATQLNKALQGLGLSPKAAAWAEVAIGIGGAASTAKIVNKAINQEIALSKAGAVKALSKGTRPDPTSYLEQSDIDAHLAKFDKGGSYLVPKDVLDRYGRDLLGYPDNSQFIMTKRQMDAMLSRANGDIALLEKELGIPPGAWRGKELVRIDIPNPRDLNLRMPSGNEAGTNDLWMPGGRLPTGQFEAIVNSIPKGKYEENALWPLKK